MITCVNNMNIDMLRIAGTGITLVLTTVFMTGMAYDKARGRLVTPVIRLSHDFFLNFHIEGRGRSTIFGQLKDKMLSLSGVPEKMSDHSKISLLTN